MRCYDTPTLPLTCRDRWDRSRNDLASVATRTFRSSTLGYVDRVENLGMAGYKAPQRVRTRRRAVERAQVSAPVRLRKWAERNAEADEIAVSPQVVRDALAVLEELERVSS